MNDPTGITKVIEAFNNSLFPINGGGELNKYIVYITTSAYVLAGILMVLNVGIKVVTYFANPSKDMDPYILVKPILIIAALALYQPLVKLLLFTPTKIIENITEDAAHYATNTNSISFDQISTESMTFVQDSSVNEDGSKGDGIYDILEIDPIFELLHLLIFFIASLVAAYIMIRQIILKGLYFVLGVFILPMSLVPGNEEILKKWFFGFLSVLLWIPILRILQTILIIIHKTTKTGITEAQPLLSVALQVCMIFFILQVPKYANFFVSGSGDSDSNGWLFFMGRETYYRNLTGGGMGNRHRRK